MYLKTTLIILILSISSNLVACSCLSYKGFIKGQRTSESVIRGKVINKIYKFEDGSILNTKEERDSFYNANRGLIFNHIEVMTIEVEDNLKGINHQNNIKLLGGNINSCLSSLDAFNINESYIWSLNFSQEFLDNFGIDFNHYYEMNVCSVSSLEYDKIKNKAKGVLRGKRQRNISYKRLIKKIT